MSLTMMLCHFRDLTVRCNYCGSIGIVDLVAARPDQKVMIYCKFLRFSQAFGFSRRWLACLGAFSWASVPESNGWNGADCLHNRLQAIDVGSANSREMKSRMWIHLRGCVDGADAVMSRNVVRFQSHRNRRGRVIRNPGRERNYTRVTLSTIGSRMQHWKAGILTWWSKVCVPTLCRCTAFELNHSRGGNCAEYVSIFLVLRQLRRKILESREALFSVWMEDN